jgi:glycerol-3-phosphate acyltransferase PlsY
MDIMTAVPFILAYLAGAFPTSIVVCRFLKGIDIRQHGSGNAGATNVYRVMGLKVALFVLFVDACKGVAGVKLPGWILPEPVLWQAILGGFCAIAGHVWTVFARFKGGKGVGTALGVFLALMPVPTLIALLAWILVFALTRYVSVASMTAGAVLAVSAGLSGASKPLLYFSIFIAVLIIVTHRANIQRLLRGTENRIK